MAFLLASQKLCWKISLCFIPMAHLGSVYAFILLIRLIHAFYPFEMSFGSILSQPNVLKHISLYNNFAMIMNGDASPSMSQILYLADSNILLVLYSAAFKQLLKSMLILSDWLFQVTSRIFVSYCFLLVVQSVFVSSASSCSIVMLECNSGTLLCHLCSWNSPAPIIFVYSSLNLTNSLEQFPLDYMSST